MAKAAYNSALANINNRLDQKDEVRAAELDAAKAAANQRLAAAVQAIRDSATNSEQDHTDKVAGIVQAIADTEQKGQDYDAAVAKLADDEQAEKATAAAKREQRLLKAKADKDLAFEQAENGLRTAGEQIGAAYDSAISGAKAGYDTAVETAKQTFEAAAASALAAANTAIESAQSGYASALSSAASARDAAIAGLSQSYDPDIVNADPAYQSQLASMRTAFQATLDGILDGFEAQITTLRAAYNSAVQGADTAFEAAVQIADDNYDSAIDAAFSTHQSSVTSAVSTFDSTVENLNDQFDADAELAADTYDQETDKADADYATEMARIQTAFDTEIARAKSVKDTFYSTKPQKYAQDVKDAAQAWADKINDAQKAYRDQMPAIGLAHLDAIIGAVTGLKDMGDSGINALVSAATAAIQQEANSARDTYLDTVSAPLGQFSDYMAYMAAMQARLKSAVLAYVGAVGGKAASEFNKLKGDLVTKLNDLKTQIVGAVNSTGTADVNYTVSETGLRVAIFEADEGGQASFMSTVAGLQQALLNGVHSTEATYARDIAAAIKLRDDDRAAAEKKRSIDKSTAGKKYVDKIAELQKTYVDDYTAAWDTLQNDLMDARDTLYSDIGDAEVDWTDALNQADEDWVNTTTTAISTYTSGVTSARSTAISSIESALNSQVSSIYPVWIAAMQQAYPNATDLSAFTSAWQSYSQSVASSWSAMASSISGAVNSYDTSVTAASNARLMSAAQAAHSAASAMAQAEATRLTDAAQALRTFDTSRTQAAIQAAKDTVQAETDKDKEDAAAAKKRNDGEATEYESLIKNADAMIEKASNDVTNTKEGEGTRYIGTSYGGAQGIHGASAANSAAEANRMKEEAKKEAEAVKDRLIAATNKIMSDRIAAFEKAMGEAIQNMQQHITDLGALNTPEIQNELNSLQTAAGNAQIPGFMSMIGMHAMMAQQFFNTAKTGAQEVFDQATSEKAMFQSPLMQFAAGGGARADTVFRKLLGLGTSRIELFDTDGDRIGAWDPEMGLVFRSGTNAQGSLTSKTRTYDEVMTYMNGPGGPDIDAAEWNGFFGFINLNSTPDPATQTWSYKAITFVIDEEKLAQPGGLASDVMITIQLATEIGGMVDPTGVCDVLNAGVLVAQGDYKAAAIATASIAVPFGAEKLAKAVRRAPVGQVDELVGAMQNSAGVAQRRVGDVAQESGELASKAGANKAKALCPDGSSCFVAGTPVLVRESESAVASTETDFDALIALGAFGAMIALSTKPASGENEVRRKRRLRRASDLATG